MEEVIAKDNHKNKDKIYPKYLSSTDYYQKWLDSQSHLIDNLQCGLVITHIDKTVVTTASWQKTSTYFSNLHTLAQQLPSWEQPQISILYSKPDSNLETFALLYPVQSSDNTPNSLVAIAITVSSQEALQKVMATLQWSTAGLAIIDYQNLCKVMRLNHKAMSDRVNILVRVLSEPDYPAAVMGLVTELAILFNCDRVSFGEYQKQHSTLKYLSHSAQFGKRMNLVRAIEQTMDESIDYRRSIFFPLKSDESDKHALSHKKLSELQGDACILSVPVYSNHKVTGAIVLEIGSTTPFTKDQCELCQSIISFVSPSLDDKRLNYRSIWRKILDSFTLQLKRTTNSDHPGRKLAIIFMVILGLFFTFAKGTYRLSTQATIESSAQRAIVAPYDGYIKSTTVRAGDKIKQGDILISLDDKDLRLERLKWLSEQAKLNRQYQEALAFRDRAKINIINAQRLQAEAQLALVESQLTRAQLTAPFDGLIISGNLDQRLGSSVTKGEVLLSVSELERYRIKMLIQENRIADAKTGQQGTLHLSALPETPFNFTLNKITPLTEALDGATYFVVEADILSNTHLIQPGMEGIGKITIDERNLLGIWLRETREWLQLKLWFWWG